MDLREYVYLMLRRWPVLVGIFAFVAGAVISLSFFAQPSYVASASVYVRLDPALAVSGSSDRDSRAAAMAALQDGDSYLQSRMTSYSLVVNTEAVIRPVIRSLGLDASYSDVTSKVAASIPEGSFVIDIKATWSTAEGAANLANAVVAQLPISAAGLDGAASAITSPVQFGVMQQALPPEQRASPNLKLNAAIALVLALFAGVAGAVLVETFDDRLRRSSQIVATGSRYLGSVPRLRGSDLEGLYDPDSTPESVMALFDRVAVEILADTGALPMSAVVTSPRAGSGTTGVVVGLASSMARSGHRVLVIDTNVDGSRVAEVAQFAEVRGLTDLLLDRAELDEVLHYWDKGGFTVLPLGRAPLVAPEMLGSAAFARQLETFAGLFDVILVDAPDIKADAVVTLLLARIPNVLMAAPARATRRRELLDAVTLVRRRGGHDLGVLMTKVTRSAAVVSAAEAAQRPTTVETEWTVPAGARNPTTESSSR